MAMVNMNNLLNGKDSRWLQLEVCREFQRNKCTRPDTECKFAHPPANVEVQNGRVTACYDSIKGRCNRDKPPCKYFHPPQHLKDQLLINGRNHLALKNALMQQMGLAPGGQPLVPGQVPAAAAAVATNPYLTGMPQVGSTFSPYFTPAGPIMPVLPPDPASAAAAAAAAAAVASSSSLAVVPQTMVAAAQKMPRSDRLEMDMKSVGSFYYDNFAFPGMVPYKRPAADKSGVPVYQPNATTYQQLMQLQQPFVPVSSLLPVTPSNAHYVIYTDEQGQLLDTLRVCQDFNRHNCKRPACKFVHLQESHVEVVDDRVTVCRDAAKGKCTRSLCKYYHIPIPLPPANEMAAAVAAATTAGGSSSGDGSRESSGVGRASVPSPDPSWAILHHALNSTAISPSATSAGIVTRGHI